MAFCGKRTTAGTTVSRPRSHPVRPRGTTFTCNNQNARQPTTYSQTLFSFYELRCPGASMRRIVSRPMSGSPTSSSTRFRPHTSRQRGSISATARRRSPCDGCCKTSSNATSPSGRAHSIAVPRQGRWMKPFAEVLMYRCFVLLPLVACGPKASAPNHGADATQTPPLAAQPSHTHMEHGVERDDPFHWLRSREPRRHRLAGSGERVHSVANGTPRRLQAPVR